MAALEKPAPMLWATGMEQPMWQWAEKSLQSATSKKPRPWIWQRTKCCQQPPELRYSPIITWASEREHSPTISLNSSLTKPWAVDPAKLSHRNSALINACCWKKMFYHVGDSQILKIYKSINFLKLKNESSISWKKLNESLPSQYV